MSSPTTIIEILFLLKKSSFCGGFTKFKPQSVQKLSLPT